MYRTWLLEGLDVRTVVAQVMVDVIELMNTSTTNNTNTTVLLAALTQTKPTLSP